MKLNELNFNDVTDSIELTSIDRHSALLYYHNKVQGLFKGTATEDIPSYVFNHYIDEIVSICNTVSIYVAVVTINEDEEGKFQHMELKYFSTE